MHKIEHFRAGKSMCASDFKNRRQMKVFKTTS